MRLNLTLMGSLRDKMPAGGTFELPADSTLQDLLNQLEIAAYEVQTISINGRFEHDYQHILMDDDMIAILPITIGHSAAIKNT